MRLLKTIVGTLYFLALSLLCSHAYAQDPADIALGVSPVATYLGGNFESVDMATGRLHVQIPLVIDHSQRGNLNFTYSAFYDSPGAWIIVSQTGHQRWVPSSKGIIGMSTGSKGFLGFSPTVYYTDPVTGNQYQFDYVKEMDGLLHPLGGVGTNLWGTIDGSGILKEISSGGQYYIFIDNSGRQFLSPALATTVPYAVQDTNGNQMSLNSSGTGVDSLGRSWTSSSTATSGCPVSASFASLWQTPGFNGGQRNFKFCYSPLTIQTQFNTPPVAEYTASITVLTGIVLPDSTTWRFDYDNYGDIWKITLPTGGTITYTWTTTHDGGCSGGNLRTVLYRAVSDGMNSSTWTYNTIISGTNSLTDPLGNVTTFQGAGCGENFIQVQYYSGAAQSGNLIKTETTTYQTLPDPYPREMKSYAQAPQLPLSTTTTWANGQVSKVAQLYDCGYFSWTDDNSGGQTYTSTCPAPSTNPAYGLVTSKTNYDYPGGSSTLSTTNTTYKALSSDSDASSYLSANLLDLTCLVTIYGPGSVPSQTSCSAPPPVQANQAAQTTYKYDESPSPTGVHGNLTSVTRWLNGGTSPKTQYSFNGYGTRITMTDPAGNLTQYTPDATGVFYNQITYPPTGSVQHVVYPTYDSNTGLITQFKDQNSQTTYYKNYDAMLRIGEIDYPDGGQTKFYYPSPTQIEVQKKIDASRWTASWTQFDGLGRLTRRANANDESSPYDQVDTCYDAAGNVHFQSYPYQGTGFNAPAVCSGAGDTFYPNDGLYRVMQVTHSDGTAIANAYPSRATCVTDEGNGTHQVKRCSQVDGLGRVTSVCEITGTAQLGTGGTPGACNQDSGGTGFLTTYGYDAMGDLTSVSQGGYLNRSFSYDSLSRLTSATNPESGATYSCYTVLTGTPCNGTSTGTLCSGDPNLVCRRTQPAPNQTNQAVTVTTTSAYDALNRLTNRTYSDGVTPGAHFVYDSSSQLGVSLTNPIGRLSEAYTDANNGIIYGYDSVGRVKVNNQAPPTVWGSTTFAENYNYDFVGDVTSSLNGEDVTPFTLTYSYNVAGRLTGITSSLSDSNHPGTLLSGAHYNALGSPSSATLNGGIVNESRSYDGRLRLSGITNSALSTTFYSLSVPTNGYAPDGNMLNFNDTITDSGQNWSEQRTWTYTYDDFNRLITANETDNLAGPAAYSYAYDRFGNRWQQNGPASMMLTFSGNNNRIDAANGVSYDAPGNVIGYHPPAGDTFSYAYDAENRLTSVTDQTTASQTCYTYDANGRRVERTYNCGTIYAYGRDFLYDLDGHQVSQVEGSNVWDHGDVYAGGQLLATYVWDGTIFFNHPDQLGSARVRTDITGQIHEFCSNLPFGELTCSGDDPSPMHFTGQEHDFESGLDNFKARYDNASFGRFMSPDPLGGKRADPQTLNKYSYVRNNPVTLIDPTGLYTINCNDDVKNCQRQEQNFDNQLQNGLKSNDASVRDAAAAYGPLSKEAGDAGDNGVNVTLTKTVDAQHADVLGQTTSQPGTGGLRYDPATNTFQQATQVTIKSGLGDDTLEETAVHEGVHVEDRAAFVNSLGLDPATGTITMNSSLNITARQSEINAYGVENIFRRLMGLPARNVQGILSHPPYSDNPDINKPLFQALPGGPPR